MATRVDTTVKSRSNRANLDENYKNGNSPYSSIIEAKNKIFGDNSIEEKHTGLTILVKESGWTVAKEYWVQPYDNNGVTAYHFVEKGTGVTDYADLDNKPTISDGGQGSTQIPLSGNVKVTASTASGDTAGVTITQGQTTGEIEMQFTLPKGDNGEDGANGVTPTIDPTTKHWMMGNTDTNIVAEGQDGQDGAPGHNPCLGVFADANSLPTTDVQDGDYAYADVLGVSHIFRYDSSQQTPWVDNGEGSPDNQTAFDGGAGPTVAGTKIDETGLANPLPNALAKAKDVSKEINGNITETEIEITLGSNNIDRYYNAHNHNVGGSFPINTTPASNTGAAAIRFVSIEVGAIYRYKGICDSDYYKILIVKPVEGSASGVITRVFSGNYRTNPLDIVVQEEETGGTIFINFKTYDSSTDGVYRVTRTSSGGIKNSINALDTRVTELEEGGMIDTTPTIVDDDTKVPTSKAVYGEINGVAGETDEAITITAGKYWNTATGVASVGNTYTGSGGTNSDYNRAKLTELVVGKKYKYQGLTNGGGYMIVVTDSTDKVTRRISHTSRDEELVITVAAEESGGNIYFNWYKSGDQSADGLWKVVPIVTGGINPAIQVLNTRVTALESVEKPFTGKTFLVFGDSLSQLGSTVTGENNKRWSDYFGEITGATIVNVAIGGARLAQNRTKSSIITDTSDTRYSNTMNIMSGLCVLNMVRAVCGLEFNASYTYMQLAQQFAQSATPASGAVGAVSRLAEVDITSIDGVIILAGANDYQAGGDIEGTGETSVQKAIELIVETLLTANPKLSIYWGTPLVCYATDDAGSGGVYNDAYWSDSYIPRSITLPGMARIIITNSSGVITRLISWNNHLEPKTISILAEESGGNMYVSFLQPEVGDGLWKLEYGVDGVETKNKVTATSGYYKASVLVNNLEVVANVGDTYSEKFVTSTSYSCIKVSSIQEGDIYQYVGVAKDSMTGEQVANFIFDKVRLQKIPVVDMYHEMGWTKTNFNQWFYDHIHPRKGLKQIAQKIAAFVIANRNFE